MRAFCVVLAVGMAPIVWHGSLWDRTACVLVWVGLVVAEILERQYKRTEGEE